MSRRNKNQRKDGRVMLRLEEGRDAQGNRKRKYFYGDTKEEAQAKMDEYIRVQNAGLSIDANTITVREWADRWLETYKATVAYKTREMYKTALNVHIKPYIGDMLLKDIRPLHLQNIATNLHGKSKSLISSVRITLSQLFRSAVDNSLLEQSPAEKITYPTGTVGSHRALERWEIDLIANNWMHHRAGIWAMLMLFAGLRRGEAIALEWESVDLQKSIIHITQAAYHEGNKYVESSTKTQAGIRDVVITKPLLKALSDSYHDGAIGKICVSVDSQPLTGIAFRRGWNGFMLMLNKQAQIALPNKNQDNEITFTPHDLRHPYVKHTLKKYCKYFMNKRGQILFETNRKVSDLFLCYAD